MSVNENMTEGRRDNWNVFHGFSEEEIHAATTAQNRSWSDRNHLICSLEQGLEQEPCLEFATSLSSGSSFGLACHRCRCCRCCCWPQNWTSCGLGLTGCPPTASSDCSGGVPGQLPPQSTLQSPVATKRATVPCRRPSNPVQQAANQQPGNPVSDKFNPGDQQQVNWVEGMIELSVSRCESASFSLTSNHYRHRFLPNIPTSICPKGSITPKTIT